MLTPTRMCFLNEAHEVRSPDGWDDPLRPRLWNYNLHYFDDLNARGADERRDWHLQFLRRWLQDNAPPAGTAWEPYPASLRTVNLVKWMLRRNEHPPDMLRALLMSARAVRSQLEYHLLGNHLFANAKALYFAGLCLEGDEAADWRRRARRILEQEVPEQVLADGAHFELSPMYHAIAVEDALDIVNVARAYGDEVPAGLDALAPTMLSWLCSMSHPDGDISFFNDAAQGIAATPAELLAYANSLGIRPAVPPTICSPAGPCIADLSSSGYARLENPASQPGPVVAMCDAAAVCPRYLPGHAHADSLSFEMSIGTQRVVINAGTSLYAEGDRRLAERSTAAHSTVQLADADSSEIWGAFRCGARAEIIAREAGVNGDGAYLRGTHDGYRSLAGRWMHERCWEMAADTLRVRDRVYPQRKRSGMPVPLAVRFLLHPEIEARPHGGQGSWHLIARGQPLCKFEGGTGLDWAIEPAQYAPEFGIVRPTTVIVGRAQARAEKRVDSVFRFEYAT